MKNIRTKALFAALCAVLLTTMTSCWSYDDGWEPVGPGPGGYYDPALLGTWQLVQANSAPVSGDNTNYMEFMRGGQGWYYYYVRGQMQSERFSYWCQQSSPSTTIINITYSDGSASTMKYWFTTTGPTRLWMQWRTSSGEVVYVYAPDSSQP